MADYLYARGARRSAAPSYTAWTPDQSGAQAGAAVLAALMRQPQQAQQAAPQMQRMNETPQQQPLGGIDPAALQALIREQVRMQQERENAAFNTESGESRADLSNVTSEQATMGPASPGAMRTLRMLATVGLGGMGLGPMAAMLNSAINNPDSSTAPTTGALMSGVRRAVPQLGALDLLRQVFGADPITREVDQIAQSIVRPTAAAPAQPAAQSGGIGDDAQWNTMGSNGRNIYGWSDRYGWGDEGSPNFSDRGPDGSTGPTDGEGSFGNNDRSGGNTGRGGIRGGGSFGEGQY